MAIPERKRARVANGKVELGGKAMSSIYVRIYVECLYEEVDFHSFFYRVGGFTYLPVCESVSMYDKRCNVIYRHDIV